MKRDAILEDEIVTWLTKHIGKKFQCYRIADGVHCDTVTTRAALDKMTEAGVIRRESDGRHKQYFMPRDPIEVLVQAPSRSFFQKPWVPGKAYERVAEQIAETREHPSKHV